MESASQSRSLGFPGKVSAVQNDLKKSLSLTKSGLLRNRATESPVTGQSTCWPALSKMQHNPNMSSRMSQPVVRRPNLPLTATSLT